MRIKKNLKWEVGFSRSPDILPEKRVPATVPGAVQLDWARAEGWDSYFYANNFEDYLWMEDVYWSYTSKLGLQDCDIQNKLLFFISKGIDYKFQIRLGGKMIYQQEGMFTPVEINLTDMVSQGDELEIIVFPAPKRSGALPDRTQADQSCKPAVSYGWDWHPRLIPLGIWDDTYLEIRDLQYIKEAEVFYTLSDELDKAEISTEVLLSGQGTGSIVWELFDRFGDSIVQKRADMCSEKIKIPYCLEKPELWWPNGQGDAVLYLSRVSLYDNGVLTDIREFRVGFRRVRLVMHKGAWDEPDTFPKTRSDPPITLEVNGRKIFCKGSNWVNPEIFPGIITEDTYRPLISLAQQANFNILRSWGGGTINKEAFFDLCDEQGIMIWQEFPLACNNYIGTPHYLAVLDQESRSIIYQLRSHACVVMWCGGNELFNAWSGMTEQSLALRLLDRNCFDLDPSRPYIMTSPLTGMAHGHYTFRYASGEDVFQVMPRAANTAYTEFGCPGPSPVELLKTFIPEKDMFPPRPGTAWETHHAFNAWLKNTWLQMDIIEDYFGPAETIEQLVAWGEILQSEGNKCIFEEARRQKPVCSMAINWCYNEPWPTAANNSLINWPARPKPAYQAVAKSCRPVLASSRIPKFVWQEGELFNPELWMLNDLPYSVPAGKLEVFLRIGEAETFLLAWEYPVLKENTNIRGPIIQVVLPKETVFKGNVGRMVLMLKVQGRPELDSEYILLCKSQNPKINRNATRTMNL